MLEKLKKLKGNQDGFTIIEVLIVLAIAGLIMIVVFLAVPNLEKSQRNNARDTDATNMLQNVSEYVANSNGNIPAACASLTACSWITYAPQQLTTVSVVAAVPASLPTLSSSTAIIYTDAVCAANGYQPAAGTSNRQYAIFYGIEGSTGTKCLASSS